MAHNLTRAALLTVVGLLGACGSTLQHRAGPTPEAYAIVYPTHAALCAASQFRQRPGIEPKIVGGGFGGHEVLFLSGVCRAENTDYPLLRQCPAETPAGEGVGLSINAHYRNANWVATEGRDFFFHGVLQPGEPLTRDAYEATLVRAKAMKILDGVEFHPEVFSEIPAGDTEEHFKYEVSLGTDYALAYARDRYCARVPLSRSQMARVVDYLNGINAPYRKGLKEYEWSVLKDNCSHLIHNALAAAGVWAPWPTHRNTLHAAFSFPVPKNEFVNLMRRTNDMRIDDLEGLYRDPVARDTLLAGHGLPTAPGALADLAPIVQDNAIYDTDIRLVFYDDPVTGRYRRRYHRILTENRYTDLKANLTHFETLYRKIESERKPLALHLRRLAASDRDGFSTFYARYYEYIANQRAMVETSLARLAPSTGGLP